MMPLAYGLIHPEPAVYLVNVAHGIPTGLDIEVGENFLLIWGVGNPGNVPMENVTVFSTLAPGVTFVSTNSPDCTYDDSIRKITCVSTEVFIPTNPRTSQITYIHTLTLDEVGFGFWTNAGVACGDFNNTQFCTSDDSFITAIEPVVIPDPIPDPVPDPIPEPLPLIQEVNVTALGEKLIILENKVIALENAPAPIAGPAGADGLIGPQGEQGIQGIQGLQGEVGLSSATGSTVDLTALENRITVVEQLVNVIIQWIISFQTAWSSEFG